MKSLFVSDKIYPKKTTSKKLLNRSPRQRSIYEFICKGPSTISQLTNEIPGSRQILKRLTKKGLLEIFTVKKEKDSIQSKLDSGWKAESQLQLNKEQKNCYQKIKTSIEEEIFQPYLLKGVTGSGKTEIYLRSIQRVLDLHKSAVMIVPEISLTPQTVERFQKRFGDQVAILHSGLTQKERFFEWKKIQDGKVSIAIGARSAIFAPFKNLGIIVIDEEHDTSYKQDSCPRYHARDSAMVRAQRQNAVVLLGSATPSLESIKNVERGKYKYLSLEKRVHNRLLPMVKVVDMKQEMDLKKTFLFFLPLLKKPLMKELNAENKHFYFLIEGAPQTMFFARNAPSPLNVLIVV